MLETAPEIESLFDELFPIPRSITGAGYRESLQILTRYLPLEVEKTPSGSQVFDWTVPKEWVITDGFLLDPQGKKIADFSSNNLSVVNYSVPIDKSLDLAELQNHLHSIPEHPTWTPYVTSYYQPNWGFCLPHSVRATLAPGKYRAVIKSKFVDGSVDCGLARLNGGTSGKLILISSYLCHPSMANNELSGPIVLAALYDRLSRWRSRRFDYLFLINPETIGSICFLARHGKSLVEKMQAGLVLTCLGGPNKKLSYKRSRMSRSSLDKLFDLFGKEGTCDVRKFDPSDGSDERQHCSSAFNLPVGQIARTTYGTNPEYHTSADNKEFVQLGAFIDTISHLERILMVHENCLPLERVQPYCELQLGKRGLYPNINSPLTREKSSDSLLDHRQQLRAITYILSYADGVHTLIDIAEMTGIGISELSPIVDKLREMNLLK